MFNIGDVVVKAGLGICRIKAVQTLAVEGKEQSLYILQSGDVKVMIPFDKAHAGALRPVMTKEQIVEIEDFLRTSFPLPGEYEKEDPEGYSVDQFASFDTIKYRDPKAVAVIIHKLFYKSKLVNLTVTEDKIYKEAMKVLSEEISYVEHSTRLIIGNRLKSVLTEGRQARKDAKFQHSA